MAVERDGFWGEAIEVPGLAALNKDGYAEVTSVSCASAGNCAAGGYYRGARARAGVRGGRAARPWGTAIEVPGLAALNTGRVAGVSVGVVRLGGQLHGRRGLLPTAAITPRGSWPASGTACGARRWVPGLAARARGYASNFSVSCGSAGSCAAGGHYRNAHWSSRVRGRRAARPLGHGDQVPGLSRPEHGRARRRHLGVVRLGRQLRGRRVLLDRHRHARGSWPSSGAAPGARRSRCPAWRP